MFIAALIGAMLVYFFSSLAIRAVGTTAQAIIVEVRRQFREMPGIMDYTQRPDYARVVDITTARRAARDDPAGRCVAVATPIIVGLLLGAEAVAGMLMVGTIAGVLLATVLNNGGGAWDNAKKYIESGHLKDDAGQRPRQGDARRTRRRSSATPSAIRSRTPPARRSTSWSSCWRPSRSSWPRCSSASRHPGGAEQYAVCTSFVVLLSSLTGRVVLGVDRFDANRNTYFPRANPYGAEFNGRARQANRKQHRRRSKPHSLSTPSSAGTRISTSLAGTSSSRYTLTEFSAESRNFLTDAQGFNSLSSGTAQPLFSQRLDNRIIGFFSRANYGYKEKYFLTGVVRKDGASMFGTGNKWAVFPAISASWRLSQEEFFPRGPFSELKLRAGWSRNGGASSWTPLARDRASTRWPSLCSSAKRTTEDAGSPAGNANARRGSEMESARGKPKTLQKEARRFRSPLPGARGWTRGRLHSATPTVSSSFARSS